MARHKRIHTPEKVEPGLDISSLIDVCFLLLIYFLVTTQIVKKEQELTTNIPSDRLAGPPPEIAPLSVLIEANGHISIRNETGLIELIERNPGDRLLPKLTKRLELFKNVAVLSGQTAMVTLQIEGDTLQQRVTDVLNALAGAKISEITLTDGDPDSR